MIAAFVAVSIVGIILTTFLARRASTQVFRNFVQNQVETGLVEALENYYSRNDSWRGIDQARFQGQFFRGPSGGQGQGRNDRVPNPGFILADADGSVLIGFQGARRGEPVSAEQLADGIQLESDGEFIGTVIVQDRLGAEIVPPALLDAFNDEVERVIILGGLGALVISVLLGALLTRSLTRPVRELTAATRQVAAGTLDEPVPVRSQGRTWRAGHRLQPNEQRPPSGPTTTTPDDGRYRP